MYGEKQAKEMRTDTRRRQRLDKKKRDAEVKKRGARIGAEKGGVKASGDWLKIRNGRNGGGLI